MTQNLRPLIVILILISCAHAELAFAGCEDYLSRDARGLSVGVLRVESIVGRQTEVIDVTDTTLERRSREDASLRIINLSQIFADGKPFLGFGRPNVFVGIPGIHDEGLGFAKVNAKSFKRADTSLDRTLDRVQSGLLLVFPDLPSEARDRIYRAAQAHSGTRQWTCVNANCRILSDAGFTLGGESLDNYYFPVALLTDILRYGLEFDGRPVKIDIIKTTPGYLEEVGLSIRQAVWTTVCRHAGRSCEPIRRQIESNSYLVKMDAGAQKYFGVGFIREAKPGPIERPQLETQPTRMMIEDADPVRYDLEVSEPSEFGTLLRMLWGPHSLFEIRLPPAVVAQHLPKLLIPYPSPKPSLSTQIKKNILFNPGVVSLMRSQLAQSYKTIKDLNQVQLFDMLRTHSDEIENKYNFVLTGDRLVIMKINVYNPYVDWILSKHVLMANYSRDVRMAGEVWKTADGVIHFNLNSGTYMPAADDMEHAVTLFAQLFPGVRVEVHGF